MKKKFIKKSLEAAGGLSLGISIIVAVLIGVGIGLGLEKLTNIKFLFWLGVFIGVAAAILNIFKAYKAQIASYKEFEKRDKIIKEKLNDTQK